MNINLTVIDNALLSELESVPGYIATYNTITRQTQASPWHNAQALQAYKDLPYNYQALVVNLIAQIINSQKIGHGWVGSLVDDNWIARHTSPVMLLVQKDAHLTHIVLKWLTYLFTVNISTLEHDMHLLGFKFVGESRESFVRLHEQVGEAPIYNREDTVEA